MEGRGGIKRFEKRKKDSKGGGALKRKKNSARKKRSDRRKALAVQAESYGVPGATQAVHGSGGAEGGK